jgi:NAD(P)H-quinone oxidoreductase subunit 5
MTAENLTRLRAGQRAALWGQGFAALCFLSALVATSYLDRLTSVLLLLSTFLFGIVSRYSARYLMGDPGQARFTIWLSLTGAFVFALVVSQNLLLFAFAWCGISLSLHQLLQFYRDRPGALLAARKKFLISRVGDAAMVAALVLTYSELGTWDFEGMFAAAERLRGAGLDRLPSSVSWICALLVFAALLKSAQFPFHSWLPDTMETPTPVSALMHAGIINAGGILIIRLSPLISLSDFALLMLTVVGGFTAVFASIVMLTQASVKRCLAFSTVAQMGFMMLECGLGAFHLALLHLVAHSLYKAHAFLSTGSVVMAQAPVRRPIAVATVVGSVFAALGISLVTATAMGVDPLERPVLSGIYVLALAQILWSLWAATERIGQVAIGLTAGVMFSVGYFALDRVAELVVTPLQRELSWPVLAIPAVFFLVALAQTQLPRLTRTSLGSKLYVHARNGFYCNTLANRMTAALWPVRVSQEGI